MMRLTSRRTLRKEALCVYVVIVVVFFISDLMQIPLEENMMILLSEYYTRISHWFLIASCGLIAFRWYTLIQKGTATETRRIHLFGPVLDLALDPMTDATLFYSALFLLNAIFQERTQGLPLEAFLVLALVALYLLYQGINDFIRLSVDTFFVQRGEKPV